MNTSTHSIHVNDLRDLRTGEKVKYRTGAQANSPIAGLTGALTVISMAALGLGTDLKILARAGGRVSIAVSLSLLVMMALAIGLIRLISVR